MNYFELLKLPQDYELDLKTLENKYLDAQRSFHPDKFINHSDAEKLQALQHTVEINKAYKVLKSDLLRAQYILSLNGIDVASEESNIKVNQQILIEAMEDRSALESSSEIAKIRNIHQNTQEKLAELISLFKMNLREKNLAEAANQTLRMIYKNKLLKDIELKLYP